MVEPCRYVPVYEPNVIPRIVFTYFPETHASALEGRVVFAREKVAGEAFTLYLELSYLF